MNRKELIRLILILDPEAKTDNISNKDLEALLAKLNAEAEAETGEEKPPSDDKPPETTEPAKKGGYVVAPGKALTAKRGIVGPGEVVNEKTLNCDKENIKKLIKAGYIVKG